MVGRGEKEDVQLEDQRNTSNLNLASVIFLTIYYWIFKKISSSYDSLEISHAI